MKKIISATLVVVLLLSLNIGVYAKDESKDVNIMVKEKVQIGDRGYEFLLDSVIYSNPYQKEDIGFGTRGNNPGHGSVKIDDVLMDSSSIIKVADEEYAKYEAAKYVSIKILKKVPGLGDLYSRLEDIYNDLSAVRSAIASMDTQRGVEVITRYSTRGFAHKLYVFDYNNSWKDMGYSLSRYYYKHAWMLVYTTDGDVASAKYDYSYSNGYSPEAIAEANHYMDKSWLANKAIAYWANNSGRYVETY